VRRLTRGLVCRSLAVAFALSSPVAGAGEPLTPAQLRLLDLSRYPSPIPPPDFALRTVRGGPVSLAGLRGKVVLLNYWATWCRECRTEMPALEMLHRRFGGRGLAVVGVNTRESRTTVQRYASELGLTFALALDDNGAVAARYGVIGLPSTFLVGRNGDAVALAVGAREWGSATTEDVIETLLAERPQR